MQWDESIQQHYDYAREDKEPKETEVERESCYEESIYWN